MYFLYETFVRNCIVHIEEKKMKRLLKFFVIGLMVVFMLLQVGCNNDSAAVVDKFELSLGEINDGVYLSKMLDLKFDAKANNMDIYYEEGLIGDTDDAIYDRTDMNEVKKKIASGATISDMGASDLDDGTRMVSIIINKAPKGKTLNKYISELIKDYRDAFKEEEEDADMMEKSYAEYSDGKIAGKKIPGIEIKSVWEQDSIREIMFYEKQLFLKYGDYIVTIDVLAYDQEDAQSLLDIFEKPDESDFEKINESYTEDKTGEGKTKRRKKRERQEERKQRTEESTEEKSSVEKNTVEETVPDKSSDSDFCAGVIDGNVYTNRAMNIKLDITGKHLVFASDYDRTLLGIPTWIISEKDKKDYVDAGHSFIDVVAHDITFENTVFVMIDEKVDLSKEDAGEDSYFDKEENVFVERKKEKINFNGKEMMCLSKIETKDNGSKYYEKYIFMSCGEYTAGIVVMGNDEEFVKNAFNMFTIIE